MTTTSTTLPSDEPAIERGVLAPLFSRDVIMFALLIVILVFVSVTVPRFATPVTANYLLINATPILLLALPMTLIIITGEIDLSVASIVGLTAATIGATSQSGWPFAGSVVAALVVGLVAGALNGFLVAYGGLPSLAVTIGTLALYRGLALVLIGDDSVPLTSHPKGVTSLMKSKIGSTGLPTVMILVVIAIVIFTLILQYSPFGRGLYALGYSAEAARFVGVRAAWSKFWLFVVSGCICSLVGVFWALSYSSRSDSGEGLELRVIAAVLLGGVSIFGGRGTVPGAITGVLIIEVINYSLKLRRIPDVTLVIITGTLLILSVVGPRVYESLRHWIRVRQVKKISHGPTGLGPTSLTSSDTKGNTQ